MSRYLSEGSPEKQIGGLGYGRRQLERRPGNAAASLVYSGASVDQTTVTTPWTYSNVLGLHSFSEDGSGAFSLDASAQGIVSNQNQIVIIEASLLIQGSGSHAIPPRMRARIVTFASGGTPALLPAIVNWQEISLPAGPVDNDLNGTGFRVLVPALWAYMANATAVGIGFEAKGAAADWKVQVGNLNILQIPVTV